MATIEGSTYQIFTNRQTLGITLPVMEPREIGSKRELLYDGRANTSTSSKPAGRGDRPKSGIGLNLADRPSSRSNRPNSHGENRSSEGTPERPSSALARGVHIMEHNDSKVNPEPIITEDAEILLEEYLSPRKLRALTGVEDLERVHYLEMKVDTRDTSLGNFGSHLPNLSQLKLSNSIISTVRDLGSCLDALKVLWIARCGVEDLDGLPAMTSLRELYLAYNEVSDISPCSMLEQLQILDLEGNNIDNLSQIHFLSLCGSLENLTLEGNPVCTTPSPEEADPTYDYRAMVKSIVPQIKLLDDEPFKKTKNSEERLKSKTSVSLFEDDWKLIEELIDQGLMVGAEDNVELDVPARPGTGLRPITSYRPGSALKPYTALRPNSRAGTRQGGRPGTSSSGRLGTSGSGGSGAYGGRPASDGRPGSSNSSGSRPDTASQRKDSAAEDDISDLTMGGVVCGNPSKALRARRSTKPTTMKTAPKLRAELKHKPEHTYDTVLENDESLKELLSELKEWKSVHTERQAQIAALKVPDVLRVDHDEAEDAAASGGELSSDEEELERFLRPHSSAASRNQDRLNAFTGGVRSKTKKKKEVPISPPVQKPPSTRDKKPPQQRFKSPASMRRMRQTFEESYEAQEEPHYPTYIYSSQQHTPPTPPDSRRVTARHNGVPHGSERITSPFSLTSESDSRPYSGPESLGPRKFIINNNEPSFHSQQKVIDPAHPVIRAATVTPERVSEAPRAATSRAAFMQPPPQLSKIRKGQLANVQLLPSRFPKQREEDAKK